MLIAAPKLGASLLIGTFVPGQMISSTFSDHAGLVSSPVRPMSIMRVAGIACLLPGVFLIERGGRNERTINAVRPAAAAASPAGDRS
jgi:transporter family-2 protein